MHRHVGRVPRHVEYEAHIGAFVDLNRNGTLDEDEPVGVYLDNPYSWDDDKDDVFVDIEITPAGG
jgi:hypothetical protein